MYFIYLLYFFKRLTGLSLLKSPLQTTLSKLHYIPKFYIRREFMASNNAKKKL